MFLYVFISLYAFAKFCLLFSHTRSWMSLSCDNHSCIPIRSGFTGFLHSTVSGSTPFQANRVPVCLRTCKLQVESKNAMRHVPSKRATTVVQNRNDTKTRSNPSGHKPSKAFISALDLGQDIWAMSRDVLITRSESAPLPPKFCFAAWYLGMSCIVWKSLKNNAKLRDGISRSQPPMLNHIWLMPQTNGLWTRKTHTCKQGLCSSASSSKTLQELLSVR